MTRKPDQRPRSRRALLSHLWKNPEFQCCDLWKEGPYWQIRAKKIVSQSYVRCIDSLTYEGWESKCRDVLEISERFH